MRNSIITSLCAPTTNPVVGDISIDAGWGQSNKVGFSSAPPTDPKYSNPSLTAEILTDSLLWETLTLTNCKGAEHGTELSFAYEKVNCKIVKVAQSATSLWEHWGIGSTLKNKLITHIQTAISSNPNRIVRVLQNQWERDSKTMLGANAYYSNLVTFYTDLQTSIGKNISDVIIVLPKSDSFTFINFPVETAIVKQAILDFANNFGAKVINQDDLLLRGDQSHLTSNSYITLGEREYAQTLLPNAFSI